jgi:hypothetical protein
MNNKLTNKRDKNKKQIKLFSGLTARVLTNTVTETIRKSLLLKIKKLKVTTENKIIKVKTE